MAGKRGERKDFIGMGGKMAGKRGERKDFIGWEGRCRESGEREKIL